MHLHLLLLARLVLFEEMRCVSGDCSSEQCPVADPPPAINVYSAGSEPWMSGPYRILGGSPFLFLRYRVDVDPLVPCCRTPTMRHRVASVPPRSATGIWGGKGDRRFDYGRPGLDVGVPFRRDLIWSWISGRTVDVARVSDRRFPIQGLAWQTDHLSAPT
jgi:hypothetical protein